MGTNFYLIDEDSNKPCKCCGHLVSPLHIGKSSAGWAFALHVIPEKGVTTLEDWRRLWSLPGKRILDEYGNEISPKFMEDIITIRRGVSRSEVDGVHCVGHGGGPWDYITGEFC